MNSAEIGSNYAERREAWRSALDALSQSIAPSTTLGESLPHCRAEGNGSAVP